MAVLGSRAVQRLARPLREHLNRHSARVAREQVDELRNELQYLRRAPGGSALSVPGAVSSSFELDSIRSALEQLDLQLRPVVESQRFLEQRLREAASSLATLRCSIDLLLGPTGRVHSRLVDDDELHGLLDALASVGGRDRALIALHQAYRTLVEVETTCSGRCASSTPDLLASLATVVLIPPPTRQVLQLGTLHGLEAIAVYRQLRRLGVRGDLTIVDRFADDDEDLSLSPTTRDFVELNMVLAGVPSDDLRLVVGGIESKEVRQEIGDRTYGFVGVDRRHLGEDLEALLARVEEVTAPEAIVVLEGVRGSANPDLAAALDRYLGRPETHLYEVATVASATLLQRRAAPAQAGR